MFALPRSSWQDFDRSLISKGGGVFSRSEKQIALSPEARKVVFDLAPYLLAKYVTNLRVAADVVRGKLPQLKVTLHQPSRELVSANEAFLRKDEKTIVELAAKNSGIQNASQKAARFVALLAKWEKLTAGMPPDHQKLGDLYQREIFSKLDVSKIGR